MRRRKSQSSFRASCVETVRRKTPNLQEMKIATGTHSKLMCMVLTTCHGEQLVPGPTTHLNIYGGGGVNLYRHSYDVWHSIKKLIRTGDSLTRDVDEYLSQRYQHLGNDYIER